MACPLLPVRAPLSLLLVLSLAACATAHTRPSAPGTGDGRIITAAQIRKSGANDAWEALKRTAPYLGTLETSSGQPTRLMRRGRSSLVLNDTPLVAIDGVRTNDFRVLQQISATTIESIRILNGVDATKQFGTGAVGGAILIATKMEQSP